MKSKSILIIEDEHALGNALSLLVTRMGHLPQLVASAAAGLDAFKKGLYDAAVIDIGLPDQSGLEVLEHIRKSGSSMPVLVVTAHATLKHAVESQKQGATAYMNKPLDMEELKVQLAALLEPVMTVEASEADQPDPASLIGAAPCLRDVFIGIAKASAGDFPVLISGPSGSGKSLAARLIHKHGRQSSADVHEVDCGSIDEWVPEKSWEGGSVLLEDLQALSQTAQSGLAAWIQSEAAGGTRVLATLSVDPAEAVEQGSLREDLYFAFKPGSMVMPPLNERSSDIPALCHFFAGLNKEGERTPEITAGVMAALQAHDWPGNVRELKHVLQYAISMSQGGALFLTHLPDSLRSSGDTGRAHGQLGLELESAIQRWIDQELESQKEPIYDQLLQRLETELLNHLMVHFDEKPTRLAEALKIHRGTLRQKLQRIGWEKSEG